MKSSLLTKIKKNFFFIFAFLVFFGVRIFILINYPKDYSDVKHDYERYANMWWYGLPPYLKHLYEYPPATIPLLIIPLALDLAGIGIYYFNYRFQIFVLEIIIYFFILKALQKTFSSFSAKFLAVIFYNLSCLLAKNFWYEGIDLVFAGSFTLGLISLTLFKKQTLINKIFFWSMFWLSVAIKFITFPLILPLFIIQKKNLMAEIKALIAGFIITWGIPSIIFRSSLTVSLFVHAKRALHASSFPAFIVYTINHFTKSEEMIKLEWFGPLSQKALFLSFILLGINTCIIIGWGLYKYFKNKKINSYILSLQISLSFFIIFMLSGKIFSPPFNIWYVLLLTIFPFKNLKTQITFFLVGIWAVIINTTNLIKLPETIMIYPFVWSYLRNLLRWPPLLTILLLTVKQKSSAKKFS